VDRDKQPAIHRELETTATRLLGRVVFYGLLVLTFLTAIPYGTAQPWSEGIFQCAVFAFALLFIVEGYLSGSWRFVGSMILLPAILLVGFAWIQSVPFWESNLAAATSGKVWLAISSDPYESQHFALKAGSLTLAGYLMLRYLNSRRRLSALITVILGVSVASAAFGILRQGLQRRQSGFVLPYLLLDSGYGQFINRNHFGFLAEMALGLGLGLIVARGIRRERVLTYAAILIVIWTALVLSGSRGALLAMIVQLVLTFLIFVRGRTKTESDASKSFHRRVWHGARSVVTQAALAIALIVIVIIGVIWIAGDPLVTHLRDASSELQTGQSETHLGTRRRDIWRDTWSLVKANPIAGVGLGGYWTAIPQYHDASGKETPQQAHNDYLELLASGGIIGFSIGLWFVVMLIKQVRRAIGSADPLYAAASWGALIALAGIAIHSLFDFGLHKTINSLIFVWLIAIIVVAATRTDTTHQLKRA